MVQMTKILIVICKTITDNVGRITDTDSIDRDTSYNDWTGIFRNLRGHERTQSTTRTDSKENNPSRLRGQPEQILHRKTNVRRGHEWTQWTRRQTARTQTTTQANTDHKEQLNTVDTNDSQFDFCS